MTFLRKANLVARTVISAVVFLFTSAQLAFAQPPPPPPPPPPAPGIAPLPTKADPSIVIPQFDVISVKPAKDSMTQVQFTADGIRGSGVTIRFLLYEGFGGLNQNQIIGEPSWSNSEGYDIEAKVAPADVPTLGKMTFEQRRTMFRSILADRFKLNVHHETRELPVYVLSVARGGPKFKESPPDDPAASPRRRFTRMQPGNITATDSQLSNLVTALSRQLGRIVIDKTGLTGNYDFTLVYTPDEGAGGPPSGTPPSGASPPLSPDQSGPSVFTAVQEQLGLKLESAKGPVDVIVIDHIEKPSEN